MEKDKELITAWVTRYALTKGILEVQGHIYEDFFIVEGRDHWWIAKEDYWLSKADAIAKAKEIQRRKLASLAKQTQKIKSLNFEE